MSGIAFQCFRLKTVTRSHITAHTLFFSQSWYSFFIQYLYMNCIDAVIVQLWGNKHKLYNHHSSYGITTSTKVPDICYTQMGGDSGVYISNT